VKWLLRLIPVFLLLAAIFVAAAAWVAFPRYAQSLIDRALEGRNIRVKLHDPGMPGLEGMRFGKLDIVFTSPPDSCTGTASTYTLNLYNGYLSYLRTGTGHPQSQGLLPRIIPIDITLQADSVRILQEPSGLVFSDSGPAMHARLKVLRNKGLSFEFVPEYLEYDIDGGTLVSNKLRLEGITYNVRLLAADHWVQQPSLLRITTLLSGGEPTPLANFQAIFGMARNPEKPCLVSFTDCSMHLYHWKAKTARIDYSLIKKETRFSLDLEQLPLNKLPGFTGGSMEKPFAAGTVSGRIPVEYRDSTILIRHAVISAGSGTLLMYYTAEGSPLLSFEAPGKHASYDVFRNLDANLTLNSRDAKLSGIALNSFSSNFLGGTLTSTPAVYDHREKKSSFTLRLKQVPLLERIRLHGDFKGSMKGPVSGTVPVTVNKGLITIRNASLTSRGNVSIRHAPPRPPRTISERIIGSENPAATYTFTNPDLKITREPGGKTTVGFTMGNLTRKTSGGELLLKSPKGILELWKNRKNPSVVTLSNFSAGFFDGSVAIDHVDYDLQKKFAETVLILNNIPLQKLLDLQGVRKIYATGTVRGKIPVIMKEQTFEIPEGGMDAEQSGQIIYSTTPEERAAANQGLRFTYEALANFLYNELISSITMAPDGKSVITLQLKGHNPDFQNGRPVHLNLNIEQNLLDLFRSLSISTNVEQVISEKALQIQNK
jgi:hypothetical protein